MQLRDLQRQYEALKPEVDKAVESVLRSGQYIMGSPVLELERELAEYAGVRHCVSCANGTDALRLILMAAGAGAGHAVFVPDFTFFATAEAVSSVGATPIFVDVDNQYLMDCADLARKVQALGGGLKPFAVVSVDLFGRPCRNGIDAFAREHGLVLVEDAAQGFGGEGACCIGDYAATSFFPAKPLGCYGDGGAVFTDSDDAAALIRSLRQHGRGTDKYDNLHIGLNSRLDTLQAAILRVKLKAFRERELQQVRQVAEWYHQRLAAHVADCPCDVEGLRSSWAQYTVALPNRSRVQQALAAAGIPSAVYYPRPLHAQPAFAPVAHLQGPCPNTDRLCGQVLSLPIHPYLSEAEVERVCQTLIAAL